MNTVTIPSFTAPGLHALLDQLNADQLDQLDFGVIGFDAGSNVCRYNRHESEAAGLTQTAQELHRSVEEAKQADEHHTALAKRLLAAS